MFTKSATEVSKTVNFCDKVASDTISKYIQLNLESDNNKFTQNLTNIRQDDLFTTGLKEFKEFNWKTSSAIDEAILQTRKTLIQYIIAIIIDIKIEDNKEQASIVMQYDFNHDDIMKKIYMFYDIVMEMTMAMTMPMIMAMIMAITMTKAKFFN